jgi:DNA-binding NarL/FixJ family response regulator
MIRDVAHPTRGAMGPERHIFLIEDNAGDILLMRQIIEEQSLRIRVHVARDGDQAMLMLTERQFEPDLIVLDLNLPKLSGGWFLARSKPTAPVVVFSCSENPADIEGSLKLGAKEFVHKPTDFQEYANQISRIVREWLPSDEAPKTERPRGQSKATLPPAAAAMPRRVTLRRVATIPNRSAARSLANFFLNNSTSPRSALWAVERFFDQHPDQGEWNERMRVLVGEELEILG